MFIFNQKEVHPPESSKTQNNSIVLRKVIQSVEEGGDYSCYKNDQKVGSSTVEVECRCPFYTCLHTLVSSMFVEHQVLLILSLSWCMKSNVHLKKKRHILTIDFFIDKVKYTIKKCQFYTINQNWCPWILIKPQYISLLKLLFYFCNWSFTLSRNVCYMGTKLNELCSDLQ